MFSGRDLIILNSVLRFPAFYPGLAQSVTPFLCTFSVREVLWVDTPLHFHPCKLFTIHLVRVCPITQTAIRNFNQSYVFRALWPLFSHDFTCLSSCRLVRHPFRNTCRQWWGSVRHESKSNMDVCVFVPFAFSRSVNHVCTTHLILCKTRTAWSYWDDRSFVQPKGSRCTAPLSTVAVLQSPQLISVVTNISMM